MTDTTTILNAAREAQTKASSHLRQASRDAANAEVALAEKHTKRSEQSVALEVARTNLARCREKITNANRFQGHARQQAQNISAGVLKEKMALAIAAALRDLGLEEDYAKDLAPGNAKLVATTVSQALATRADVAVQACKNLDAEVLAVEAKVKDAEVELAKREEPIGEAQAACDRAQDALKAATAALKDAEVALAKAEADHAAELARLEADAKAKAEAKPEPAPTT